MIAKSSFNVEMKLVKFLDMNVTHDYYSDGLSNDFTILPTTDTARVFSQLGVIFKKQKFGFILFCNATKANTVIQYFKKPLFFRFLITNDNSLFQNFSETKVDDFHKIYYIDSSNSKKNKEKNIILNQDDFFAKKENSIPVLQIGSKVTLTDSMKNNSTAKIFSNNGELLDQLKLDKTDKNTSVFFKIQEGKLSFDSTNLDEGKYLIEYNNNQTVAFCGLQNSPKNLYGIIELGLFEKTSKSRPFSIINNNKFTYNKTLLQFKSRASFWRYTIVDKNKGCKDISNISIKDNGETIKISKPKLGQLSDGTECITFDFLKERKLKNIESTRDRLSMELTRKGKKMLKPLNLPKPSANTRIIFEGKKPISVVFYNI